MQPMETQNQTRVSGIFHPPRPLSRRSAEPILFLAELMARADQDASPRELRMIDRLADAVGMPTFRHQPWFRNLTEPAAISQITTDLAKRATMVVLTLVLKADAKRRPSEMAYFRKIREAIGADPVTVPVGLDEHLSLALEYFIDEHTRSAPR